MTSRTVLTCDACNKDMEYDDIPYNVDMMTTLVRKLINAGSYEYGMSDEKHFCSIQCLGKYAREIIEGGDRE